MKTFLKCYTWVKKIMLYISLVCVFVMMFYITIDVLFRNFSTTALVGTYEIVGNYLMPICVFFSVPYTYTSGVMPRIVMLTNKFSKEKQVLITRLTHVLSFLAFLLLGYFSLLYAIKSTGDRTAVIIGSGFSAIYPLHYLPPLAFLMIMIEDLIYIFSKDPMVDSVTAL
jgi:TRAP-type C4-dicarboxylate transport system permease small subunit